MAARSTNLSIIEAVETLSSIADLEFDRDIGIAQKHEVILDNQKINYKTVHWLHRQDAATTVNLVKDTFRVVLHYLRQFYNKEYSYVTDPKTVEGIKTIMVLVGEAAKKLDRHTALFHQAHMQSVTEFKEYKQLQDFYFSKIAHKIDEGILGKWVLGLELNKKTAPQKIKFSHHALSKEETLSTKHVFVDLETVKKDTEYELFFIRKEDGSRFFSPRLLRNIKLVCDFGHYFGAQRAIDPLEHLTGWFDRSLHLTSRNLLKALGFKLEHFFKDLHKIKNHELVDILSKALFALMMSSHTYNLTRHHPVKNCTEYFEDFQSFLRQALRSRVYQTWIASPPKESNHFALDLLDLIHSICRALYINVQGFQEMGSIIHVLIGESSRQLAKEPAPAPALLWERLSSDYASMNRMIKKHPNGPLLKVLNFLEESSIHVFDPLTQHNIPCQLFDLYRQDKRVNHIRFPSPVLQEFIHRVGIVEEFKGFLRNYQRENKKHLLINLQDRTSWREHARCSAIEELQNDPEFRNSLCVVTLAIDTDFFHQLAPYHQISHAEQFIDQFKEHLKGEESGFYFPSSINKKELSTFVNQAFESIHRFFFSGKNVLSRERRLDFIEIFYVFLQLKLVDLINPDSFSLTCKDSVDTGASYSVELFAFLKLLHREKWTETEIDHLNFMLYAPALLVRERIILPERFNRFISALKTIESVQQELGPEQFSKEIQEAFGPLFKSPIGNAKVMISH